MLLISSSEDPYAPTFVFTPALVLLHSLPVMALAPFLAPSLSSPLEHCGVAHRGPTSPAPPRSPRDCPACCLASTLSSGVEPAPPPVRPWHEVKSRRGAPKRVNSQGFACPNRKCPHSGITDADIHAPLWRWYTWPC